MSGLTNYPTALDDDSSLLNVVDGASNILAAHHNNLKEAVKQLEAKLGIRNTSAATSIDFRLSDATAGHNHNSASGMGARIDTALFPQAPSSISAFRGGLGVQVPVLPTAPAFATAGQVIFDDTTSKFRGFNGVTWDDLN